MLWARTHASSSAIKSLNTYFLSFNMFYKMLNSLLLTLAMCGMLCESKKPNFLVILTDDQDDVLGGMTPMQNVKKFIGSEGITFTNSYTVSPICCPSRASFLTGQYVHNHGTVNNSLHGGCYSESWRTNEHNTFANVFKNNGYSTFYAGKYLNEYGTKDAGGPERVPPGWTAWHGLVGNSVYYGYVLSNDGVPTHSTDLYLTDVIRDLAVSYVENQTDTKPFLMVLAPPAPHQPFTPARRHQGKFDNITAVRHPNFNVAVHDKHWLMTMPPSPLPASMLPELDRIYRSRWETLLAVDEMVADVIGALDTASLLDNTYLIYTSDNGYHVGQFAQPYDKRQPYETDVKVPLLIRGPSLPKNVENHQPVLNIDLAPTLLELAGLNASSSMDGKPIDFGSGAVTERNILIEYHGESRDGTVDPACPWVYDSSNLAQCQIEASCKCQDSRNNTYGCVRFFTERINTKYCLFSDDDYTDEFYDLTADPYELTNVINQILPAVRHWYQSKLSLLLACAGSKECNNLPV